MAQVVKKSNDLAKKYVKMKALSIVGYVICGICFLSFAFTMTRMRMENFQIYIVLLIGFGAGGAFGGFMTQKAKALESGIEGEAATAAIISALPETYFGVQNAQIPYAGKTSELDMIVVGPTGVFIIETKNMNGTIVGNYDNPQWTQKKVGQQGTPYSKSFYNPVKQVGTHVYRLANFLKSNGIDVYVDSMVYFSNPDTVIQLIGTPSQTPVYSALANGASEILGHIQNREQKIAPDTIIQIATLFNQLNG